MIRSSSNRPLARSLWLALGLCVFAAGFAMAQETSLVGQNEAYDEAAGVLTFDLVNETRQAITAWDYSVIRLVDGLQPERVGGGAHEAYHSADLIPSGMPPKYKGSGPLLPGQREECKVKVERKNPADVLYVAVNAVIFFDTSSEGDAKWISDRFEERAGSFEEYSRILRILQREQTVLSDKDLSVADTLDELSTAISSPEDYYGKREPSPYTSWRESGRYFALSEILDYLSQFKRNATSKEDALDLAVRAAERKYDLAVAHTRHDFATKESSDHD